MPWQVFAAGLAMASNLVVTSAEVADAGKPETIAVTSEQFNRMTVPVKIQGGGPYQFLIDTGAQATVVSFDLASRLELSDRRNATLVGLASRRPVETVAIDGMSLGRRNFNVTNAPLISAENIGADGVLGLDSLQGQRVMIDFKANLMHVASARDLGGNRGYEIIVKAKRKLGQLIITQAVLDGVKTAVIIDTGAQGSTGNPALLSRLRRTQHVGEGTVTDINGVTMTSPMRETSNLTLGRVYLRNVPMMFTPSPTFDALGLTNEPALILGMQQLRVFKRVAIDFDSQRILFDLPDNVDFTDSVTFP